MNRGAYEPGSTHSWKKSRGAFYAASIAAMDDQIGRVLQALDKQGMRDNTIIFFQSDNGGTRNKMFDGEGECRRLSSLVTMARTERGRDHSMKVARASSRWRTGRDMSMIVSTESDVRKKLHVPPRYQNSRSSLMRFVTSDEGRLFLQLEGHPFANALQQKFGDLPPSTRLPRSLRLSYRRASRCSL